MRPPPNKNLLFHGILPLLLTLTIVSSGFFLLFQQNSNYVHFEHQLDKRIENETGKMAIGTLIVSDLNNVKAYFYQMITPMDGERMRQTMKQAIYTIAELHDALNVLDKGGVIMRRLPVNVVIDKEIMFPIVYFPEHKTEYNLVVLELRPQLIQLEKYIKQVPEVIAGNSQLLAQTNPEDIKQQVHRLIHFIQKTTPLFSRLTENANTLSHTSRSTLRAMQKDSDRQRKQHLQNMKVTAAFGFILILLLVMIVFRQIVTTRRLLEEQVIKLQQADTDLQTSYTEVTRIKESLEEQVAHRTRELTTTNTALQHQMERRIASDRHIRREKELWEQTFAAIPDIITIQDNNFTILQSNKAGHRFFKKSGNIIGRKCFELFHSINAPCQGCPNLKLERDGRSHVEIIEHEQLNKWFSVSSSPVLEADNQIQYIVHVARDITEQKILENNFLQAQKMESIGRLAGGVAHDFNNILSAINGYAELTLMKMAEDAPFREELEIILESGRRASRLTHQLLAFSRKQVIHREFLYINNEIKDSLKMLGRILGEHIEISVFTEKDLWPVLADRSQMEQILLNLAVNSSDAMPGGGKLTIETSNIILDEEFSHLHNDLTPGEYIVFSISDTGEGITKEVLEHIFEPFFTTKEQGKGTGLGLATVHGIIKQHKGEITIDSECGQGTTFNIYLPRAAEKNKDREENTPLLNDVHPGENTILVIEDDNTVRAFVHRALEIQGYRIITATDGEEGLRIFRQHQEEIDLLLSDMVMPKMGGAELAEIIQQESPGMKVLFMSGYTERTVLQQGNLTNGINFIPKPVTVQSLTRAVRSAVAGKIT